MIIRDILKVKTENALFSIEPDGTLAEAVALMVQNDVGSLVVMHHDHLLGMVTFREVLAALHRHGENLSEVRVSTVMVHDPIFGNPDDSVDYVRGVMLESNTRYLPVMEGDRLLAVISFHDVAKALINQANFENKMLKRYIKSWPE